MSRVTGTLEVRLSPQDLSGTRLEMCHAPSTGDPHCAVSELRWHLDALSCGTRLSDRRNAVTFDTSPRVSSEGVSLSPTYYPGAGEEFADGDRFTIRLLDPSESTVLAETSGTVAHFAVTSTPACQGDEPVCRSGSF
ncbi:hypothetical protein AKJ09_09369 [Labilithrix luteola]|uniref:Uncharacterized protein n=1 Tax=Labilithrix luteola TaxID=1391654 RepID=A0A0K1QAB1_9BACT|nr:hypothetical protein AKJ09_09369 [Labilithrix luteola]